MMFSCNTVDKACSAGDGSNFDIMANSCIDAAKRDMLAGFWQVNVKKSASKNSAGDKTCSFDQLKLETVESITRNEIAILQHNLWDRVFDKCFCAHRAARRPRWDKNGDAATYQWTGTIETAQTKCLPALIYAESQLYIQPLNTHRIVARRRRFMCSGPRAPSRAACRRSRLIRQNI
jgi:hypothetical protein